METLFVIAAWILIAVVVVFSVRQLCKNWRLEDDNAALEIENERLRKELTDARDLCFRFRDLFK